MDELAEQLSRFVNANLPGGAAANFLFHYTGIEVFRSLLQDEEDLYARHCSFCKGQGEILPGCTAMLDRLVQREVFSLAQREEVLRFIKERLANENSIFAEQNAMVPYVTSFSYDPDSAYHWEHHTPKGNGCVIRFDRKALNYCVHELQERFKSSPKSCDAVMLLPCYYLDAPKVIQYLDVYIDSCIDVFRDFSFERNRYENAITTIVLASVMVKESGFKKEREWRLVRWLSEARSRGQRDVRERGGEVLQMNHKQLKPDLIYAGFREVVSPFRDLIRGVKLSRSSVDRMDDVKKLLDDYCIGYTQKSVFELRRPEVKYPLHLMVWKDEVISSFSAVQHVQ